MSGASRAAQSRHGPQPPSDKREKFGNSRRDQRRGHEP